MENKLYVLPEELNTEIAALKLQAMGAGIDTLSEEQRHIWQPNNHGNAVIC